MFKQNSSPINWKGLGLAYIESGYEFSQCVGDSQMFLNVSLWYSSAILAFVRYWQPPSKAVTDRSTDSLTLHMAHSVPLGKPC